MPRILAKGAVRPGAGRRRGVEGGEIGVARALGLDRTGRRARRSMTAIERGRTAGTRGVGRSSRWCSPWRWCLSAAGGRGAGGDLPGRPVRLGGRRRTRSDRPDATEGAAFSLNRGLLRAAAGDRAGGDEVRRRRRARRRPGMARARWVAPPGTSFAAAHLTWPASPQPGNWQGLGVDDRGRIPAPCLRLRPASAPTPVDVPIEGRPGRSKRRLGASSAGRPVGCDTSAPSVDAAERR